MQTRNYSLEEVGRRGQELYENTLRSHLETPENEGKVLVLDIETGDYELDADHVLASQRVRARRPDAVLYALRIGYPTLGKVGGGWRQLQQP